MNGSESNLQQPYTRVRYAQHQKRRLQTRKPSHTHSVCTNNKADRRMWTAMGSLDSACTCNCIGLPVCTDTLRGVKGDGKLLQLANQTHTHVCESEKTLTH